MYMRNWKKIDVHSCYYAIKYCSFLMRTARSWSWNHIQIWQFCFWSYDIGLSIRSIAQKSVRRQFVSIFAQHCPGVYMTITIVIVLHIVTIKKACEVQCPFRASETSLLPVKVCKVRFMLDTSDLRALWII